MWPSGAAVSSPGVTNAVIVSNAVKEVAVSMVFYRVEQIFRANARLAGIDPSALMRALRASTLPR
jgi:hypothetical protein